MIDLVPDELQAEVVSVARRALAPTAGLPAGAVPDATWRTLADVGVLGIAAPESSGGSGLGVAGAALVAEAAGAALAPVGVLATIAATTATDGAETITGHARAAVGVPRAPGVWTAVDLVVDGPLVLLDAVGVGAVVVGAEAIRHVDALVSLDDGATLSAVHLDPTRVESARGATTSTLGALVRLVVAAAAVGVSRHAIDRSTAYASIRQQFGKPIGSFQAVKHRCVDMAVLHEAALASVRFAAVRADAGIRDDVAIATAALLAGDAARRNAAAAIQVFGGIGFTAENGLQHLLHRAWLLQLLLGARAVHEEALLGAATSSGARHEKGSST